MNVKCKKDIVTLILIQKTYKRMIISQTMSFSWLKYVLQAMGIAILVVFLTTISKENLTGGMSRINILLLSGIIILTLLNLILKGWRWQILVGLVSGSKVKLRFCVYSVIAGVAGGSFIPGRMEMVKPMLLKTHEQIPFAKSVPAILTERVLDFVMIGVLFVSALILVPLDGFSGNSVVSLIVLLIIAVLVLRFIPPLFYQKIADFFLQILPIKGRLKERVQRFLKQFFITMQEIQKSKRGTILTSLSLVAILLEITRLVFILYSFGLNVTLPSVVLAFSASVFISILSLIPGGVGISEVSLSGILHNLNPTASGGLIKSAIITNRFFAYYLLVLIGVGLIFGLSRHKKLIEQSSVKADEKTNKVEGVDNTKIQKDLKED